LLENLGRAVERSPGAQVLESQDRHHEVAGDVPCHPDDVHDDPPDLSLMALKATTTGRSDTLR